MRLDPGNRSIGLKKLSIQTIDNALEWELNYQTFSAFYLYSYRIEMFYTK